LSQKEDGSSLLKVKEKLTAVFPNYKQNKGICRDIPFTNQNGKNRTMDKPSASSLNLKRNGITEPVYSIERENDYYEICTGDESYVLGPQVYSFEYEFYNVITDFDNYQELYWDTNGTGWKQKFSKVTARFHFADSKIKDSYDGQKWCYVGKYGINNQTRCKITEISDGLEFVAENLLGYENMTVDIQFKPNSFVVLEPPVTYMPIIIMCVALALSVLIIVFGIRKYIKKGEKRRFYNDIFVKPEYNAPTGYDIAEVSEIYIGEKKNVNVAILLNLIVHKKISLVKKEEKGFFGADKWAIKVLDLTDVPEEEVITLKLLNAGSSVAAGDLVDIKSRTATSSTISLGKSFDAKVKAKLSQYGLIESKYHLGGNGSSSIASIIMLVFIFGLAWGAPLIMGTIAITAEMFTGMNAIGVEYAIPIGLGSIIIAITVRCILSSKNQKYEKHTHKGLELSRYMDGLKLYIKMAEADRLAVLQSVKNVDVSNEGIVKLYEKLLPYAAIFGLEKSWMKELEKYYKLADVKEPDWYSSDLRTVAAWSVINSASSYAGRASMSAGSGGSSSGHSGGGGGGFSGGGGGGGGGGGR
jgi:uncharacterized membrane protein YgcG